MKVTQFLGLFPSVVCSKRKIDRLKKEPTPAGQLNMRWVKLNAISDIKFGSL